MKLFAAMVMLVALFLLYRIAYPKPTTATKKGDDVLKKKEIDADNVVGKSRFVRSVASQPQTTSATALNTEKQEEKAYIFAPKNGKIEAIIPFDRLDEIFDEDDLDIPPDEDESDENAPDADEESEELRQVLGEETEFADGFSIEEMGHGSNPLNLLSGIQK